jgi:hypothetical protein
MPNVQEITNAIDDRLTEIRQQIASLEAARQALTGTDRPRRRGRAESRPAAGAQRSARARRSRTTSSGGAQASVATPPAAAPAPAAPAPPVAQAQASAPPKPARRQRRGAPAAGRSAAQAARSTAETQRKPRPAKPSAAARRRELEPGQVEALLRDSEDGLSLVALARRTGVTEAKVADRLRTLERTGEARSSGPRRTSLWRLVSDEERIAERAAELARASKK